MNWQAERAKTRGAPMPRGWLAEMRRVHPRDERGWMRDPVVGAGDILRLHELGLVREDGTWTCTTCARGVTRPPAAWVNSTTPMCDGCAA